MVIVQTLEMERVIRQPLVPPLISVGVVVRSESQLVSTVEFLDNSLGSTIGATAWNDHQLSTILGSDVEIENLTPGICAISGNGYVSRVAPGIAKVRASSGGYTSTKLLDMRNRGGLESRQLAGFVFGSVAKFFSDEILAIADVGKSKSYFSTYDHASATFVKNTDCWAAEIDITGVALGSDLYSASFTSGGKMTAVTARHCVGVKHWGITVGKKLRFRDAAGTLHERTIIGLSTALSIGDLMVATLDSPLPAGCTPLKITGDWFLQASAQIHPNRQEYFASGVAFSVGREHLTKLVLLDSIDEKTLAYQGDYTVAGITKPYCDLLVRTNAQIDYVASSLLDAYLPLYESGISGDSGGPICLYDGTEAILISAWTTGSGGICYPLENGAAINASIAAADADAGISTGLTIAVAPDPTL